MKLSFRLTAVTLTALAALLFATACHTLRTTRKWGIVQNPSGLCSVVWTNHAWTFSLPGGIFDLSPYQETDNRAPRVLREVTGNFTAEVKVTGELDPGTVPVKPGRAAYFGAGLLLWDGSTNYFRLERNEWTYGTQARQRHGPLFEHWVNNRNLIQNDTLTRPFFRDDSTWLRLQRSNNVVTASYSHDGVLWTSYKSATGPLPETVQIGVAAISTSVKPYTVTFSDFSVR